MPRTIVYDSPQVRARYQALVRQQQPAGTRINGAAAAALRREAEQQVSGKRSSTGANAAEDSKGEDGYLSKIAKYVPAETITLTTLGFAAFKPTGPGIWLWLALGSAVNGLYLFSVSLATVRTLPPPPAYFYVLAIAAYFLWAMAVVAPVQKQAGLTGSDAETKQTFVLASAAFVIPALDAIGGWFWTNVRTTSPKTG
jgi:hypothetical protein